MNDINLVAHIKKQRTKIGKLFLSTAILFGLVFAAAFLITIYQFFLKTQEARLSRSIAEARNKIANMSSLKQKVLVLSERISGVKSIISKRSTLEERAYRILALIPDTFRVEAINVEKDKITMILGSAGLLAFDDLLEAKLGVIYRDQNLGIKKIESSSFSRNGNYLLTLAFYFGQGSGK